MLIRGFNYFDNTEKHAIPKSQNLNNLSSELTYPTIKQFSKP